MGVPGNASQAFALCLAVLPASHSWTVLFPHLERVKSAYLFFLPYGLLRLFTDFFPLIWKLAAFLPGCLPGLQSGPAWVSVPTGNQMCNWHTEE